jgi:hypothetical protein
VIVEMYLVDEKSKFELETKEKIQTFKLDLEIILPKNFIDHTQKSK